MFQKKQHRKLALFLAVLFVVNLTVPLAGADGINVPYFKLVDFETQTGANHFVKANGSSTTAVSYTQWNVNNTGPGTFSGVSSLKWDYHIAAVSGTRTTAVGPAAETTVPKGGAGGTKNPLKIGFWMYADANLYDGAAPLWLRSRIMVGGASKDLTLKGDWLGGANQWRWIEFNLTELIPGYSPDGGEAITFGSNTLNNNSNFLMFLATNAGYGKAGTVYIDDITFIYDGTYQPQDIHTDTKPPVAAPLCIDGAGALDGAVLDALRFDITATVSDPQEDQPGKTASGIHTGRISALLDGQDCTGNLEITPLDGSVQITLAGLTYSNGNHRLEVTAYDNYGFAVKQSAAFTVEAESPQVSLKLKNPQRGPEDPLLLDICAEAAGDFESAAFTMQIGGDFYFGQADLSGLSPDSYVEFDKSQQQLKLSLTAPEAGLRDTVVATVVLRPNSSAAAQLTYQVLAAPAPAVKYNADRWPSLVLSMDTAAMSRSALNTVPEYTLMVPAGLEETAAAEVTVETSGAAAANVEVLVFDEFWQQIGRANTDAQGKADLPQLTAESGFYHVAAYAQDGNTQIVPVTVLAPGGIQPQSKVISGETIPGAPENVTGKRESAGISVSFDNTGDAVPVKNYALYRFEGDTPGEITPERVPVAVLAYQQEAYHYLDQFSDMNIYAPYTYVLVPVDYRGIAGTPAQATVTEVLSAPWNAYFAETDATADKYHTRALWLQTISSTGSFPQTKIPGNGSQAQKDAAVAAQQKELLDFLDLAEELHVNVVFFQVRPTADAFYHSELLPSSLYLFDADGKQGDDPGWDPLAYIIQQAHTRSIELHAWFNPYRIGSQLNIGRYDTENNVRYTHPDWVTFSNGVEVVDPGIPAARMWVEDTIMEVVEKYDIDGVHFDDYFYYETNYGDYDSYSQNGFVQANSMISFAAFNTVEAINGRSDLPGGQVFHHAEAFAQDAAGKQAWRENNVNLLIRELRVMIAAQKPWVQLGIGPAGIWANKEQNGSVPGNPEGSDTLGGAPTKYSHAADTLKWAREGWIDYIAPQIYWSFSLTIANHGVLMDWWSEKLADTDCLLYTGSTLSKVSDSGQAGTDLAWVGGEGVKELQRQLRYAVNKPGVEGNVLWSYTQLNKPGVLEMVKAEWAYPAVPVAMPWKADGIVRKPGVQPEVNGAALEMVLTPASENTHSYLLYQFAQGEAVNLANPTKIAAKIPAQKDADGKPVAQNYTIAAYDAQAQYVITALDRANNESGYRLVQNDVPVEEIVISGENQVAKGESIQLAVQVKPETATEKQVVWSVEHGTGEAEINEEGLLKGRNAGTVTVKATAADGSGVFGLHPVTVTEPSETPSPAPSPVPGVSITDLQVDPDRVSSKGGSVTVSVVGPENSGATVAAFDESGRQIAETAAGATGKATLYFPKNTASTEKIYTVRAKAAGVDMWSEITVTVTVKPALPFTDIKPSKWYFEDVEYMWENNLMYGLTKQAFGPESTLTRAMLVTILGREAGVDVLAYTGKSGFTDVPEKAYYAAYVKWAEEAGIFLGTGSQKFNPGGTATREQIALVLCRYAAYRNKTLPQTAPAKHFTDTGKLNREAQEAIGTLTLAGIIQGRSSTRFDPKGNVTRAEVAALVHRFAQTAS